MLIGSMEVHFEAMIYVTRTDRVMSNTVWKSHNSKHSLYTEPASTGADMYLKRSDAASTAT
jgi:hypothetical protein